MREKISGMFNRYVYVNKVFIYVFLKEFYVYIYKIKIFYFFFIIVCEYNGNMFYGCCEYV